MEQLVYEITIDEVDESVNFVALTDDPAIQRSFMAFNRAKDSIKFSGDSTQRTIFGPLILADTPILRVNKGREYYVTFPKPTIRKIVEKFFKANNQHNVNAYHKIPIDGLYMYESMITDFSRGVKNPKGYEDVPEGSWYGAYKVENDEVWDDFIKTGVFTGFSVEGFFGLDKKEGGDEFESYNDYGEEVRNNAKRGIELNEKNGNKCAEAEGKIRARQLADGRNISLSTIKRMHSFLSRAETYYDGADSQNDCGYISYLLWGGKSGLSWARNKLKELGELESQYFDLPSPGDSEGLTDFMNRCMADDKMNSEFPDSDQRYAVCVSQTKKYEADFEQVRSGLLDEISLFLQTFDH
jgi:hypothetical protein